MNNVHEYIIICSVCQNKIIHCYQFYNQLKSFFILKNAWNLLFKKISLNWITKLLSLIKTKNNQKYNSILTVICCIIKYVLFILIQNDTIAADFMKLFFKHVECCFDFSKNIMTNKNSCITSDFWWEICKIQIIKQHLSTAYHFQINDQNKVLNWIIENYLRVYTSENQIIWAKLLFLAQFIYNNSCNHIT